MKKISLITGEEVRTVLHFVTKPIIGVSIIKKIALVWKFYYISRHVECPHTNREMITIAQSFLNIPPSTQGVFVEAGSFKGGSAVKLSLVAKLAGRNLIIFDSFQGLPASKDLIVSDQVGIFNKGQYKGTLTEVKTNLANYGVLEVCTFKKGWFEKTMPAFHEPVAGIFLDVDLPSSTKTCLKYLYPLLKSKGVLFSHDGHIQNIVNIFKSPNFWQKEVNTKKPKINGLGKQKLLSITKR